jgi:hypothetical protein
MRKAIHNLWSVKDNLGLLPLSLYCISCEYGEVYVVQMFRTMAVRSNKHKRRLQHGQRKIAVVEHAVSTGHAIYYNQIHKLHRTTIYVDWNMLWAHPEDGDRLSTWNVRRLHWILSVGNPQATQEEDSSVLVGISLVSEVHCRGGKIPKGNVW